MPGSAPPYYLGKEALLADIFGATSVVIEEDGIKIGGRRMPVIDDVIIALPSDRVPSSVRQRLGSLEGTTASATAFAEDVQYSFGDEWTTYGDVLPEHTAEFEAYFDLVDLDALREQRVADLGCGSGRWAWHLAPHCREIVLVDFSDAIFVARRNLASADNPIFVMGDVLDLPFREDAFDFAYCLGVLHHLPVDALQACRKLAPLAPKLLVYLYYALDNRPAYFRAALRAVTELRTRLAKVRSPRARGLVTWLLALTVYVPLANIGHLAGKVGLRRYVPLAETYGGKSVRRIRQDVYDRFFTSIEQRFCRDEIRTLDDTFASVEISDGLPYWHFLCTRGR